MHTYRAGDEEFVESSRLIPEGVRHGRRHAHRDKVEYTAPDREEHLL